MKNSTIDYVRVRFWIIILHSIAPISIAYCLWITCVPGSWRLPRVFTLLAFSEAAFYVLTYAYRRHYLQRPALHPAPTTKEERDELFARCQASTPDHRRYIENWFLGASLADIRRDNVKQFLRWGFLNADLEDSSNNDNVDDYVLGLESSLGKTFPPGHSDVRCIRLTLDEVNALHRSLIWYMVRNSSYVPWQAWHH